MKLRKFLLLIPLLTLIGCGKNENTNTWSGKKEYTITWKGDNNLILDTDRVKEGETPTYKGKTPTKSDDSDYTYTWSGWTPEVGPATADQTYTATFTQTRLYTVSFVVGVDSATKTVKVKEGQTVAKPDDPIKMCYDFAGWFTDEELTNAYDFATKVNSSFSLYAKWELAEEYKDLAGFLFSIGYEDEVIITGIVDKTVTSITVPNCVEKIYNSAFENCTAVKTITIAGSVIEIGDSALKGCSALETITLPMNNFKFEDIFGGEDNVPESLKTINVSKPTTTLRDSAFSGCSSVKTITLPDSLTSISKYAFKGCTSLDTINIPNEVTSIGMNAFQDCTSLESIDIPESVTSIGTGAFLGCTALRYVSIPDSIVIVGNNAFASCPHLEYIQISFIRYLGNENNGNVFLLEAEDKKMSSYTIWDNTKVIGSRAFAQCQYLTSITIPDTVVSIGESAFSFCTELTSITLPESLVSIGDTALYACESLTSITFNGTKAEWEAVEKGDRWNAAVAATEVTCSDGAVPLS